MDGRGFDGEMGPWRRGHLDAVLGGGGGRIEGKMPVGEAERGMPDVGKDHFMLTMAGFQSGDGRAGAGRQPAGAAMLAFLALASAAGVELHGGPSAGLVAKDGLGQGGAHGEEQVEPNENESDSPPSRRGFPPEIHSIILVPCPVPVNPRVGAGGDLVSIPGGG